MKIITLEDKDLFKIYLKKNRHFLSYFSFINIFIWKNLFEISYLKIKDSLCIFFKDRIGVFMVIPPLGNLDRDIVFECFEIMDSLNQDKNVSRIEGVEENNLDFYRDLGFKFKLKDREYICLREDMISLKGNRFKSKRNSYNYFLRNYRFQYLEYNQNLREDCIGLYKRWKDERKRKFPDPFYGKMLDDNFSALNLALQNFKDLDLVGRVIEINNEISGFSFGFELNKNTFSILFEITDLRYKGISQFLFREFCRELCDYEYINIMGDCSLENLRRTKLSYHPVLEIPEYIITR